MLLAAQDRLKTVPLDELYESKNTGPESSTILRVLNIVEHKLRKVIREPPTREREVQDALEGLLIGADVTYSREAECIEYSSKTYRPDFTLTQIDLAVEIKLCGKGGREVDLIAEINDDIVAYATRYGNQLFVVYDVGQIRDIERFTSAFESNEGVLVDGRRAPPTRRQP
jgi:hypothetical protein